MKLFFNLFGMALAGALGYLMEPNLRFQLTGQQPSAVERAEHGRVILKTDDDAPQIDVAALSASQLPSSVQVKSAVKVANAASGNTMTVDSGNRVNLVRIDYANAVISPAEGFEGRIPITETDLLDQLAANPPAQTASAVEPPAVVEPPPVMTPPEPVTPPVVENPTPTSAPEIAPDPAPEPTPPATPAPAPTAGGGDPVAVMQASIKAGQIKEFTFDQVQEWKAGEDETVDGESFQTGLASYKAGTIFGVKTIQAKALIKDGKVQRWSWPKSGMEIK